MQTKVEGNNHSVSKIFYWNGVVDPQGISEKYADLVDKLVDGNYQGLDLEKLVGHDVFSVRVNHSDRLLFTTIKVHGQPYLMLLDEVLNHDYAKSRFLKPSVLKNYLELHGKVISEEIISTHFKSHSGLNLAAATKKSKQPVQYSRIDFYNQKFIELDACQLDVATRASLPLIISGVPGSGKSCIALLMLVQYVESNSKKKDYPILYVTESDNLASNMQRAWLALPAAQGLDASAVQIKSYKQLIRELSPGTAQMTFVDKEHCKIWLGRYIKQTANQRKGKNIPSTAFFTDIDSLYQEFRIISACPDEAAYMALGQRQSLYQDDNEKNWLFSAFTAYLRELAAKACVHAPFYHLDKEDHYKRIVVDEAQDLSHKQLEILSMLACNRQICFCEDNRQSLSDNKSKIPFLKQLIHSWGMKDSHINLQASYRCPSAVIRMANVASGLKSIVTGNGQQEIVSGTQESEGQVVWHDTLTEAECKILQQAAQSPDFAIVTLEEFRDEVRKSFNTMLVFTVDECKGLEYRHILAWRLLDSPLFREADKIIGDKPKVFKKSTNRAKQDKGKEEFGPLFNGLYTAFTRATDTLTVVQKKHYYLKNICSEFIKVISGESVLETPVAMKALEEDKEQWFQQARIQIVQGNVEIAQAIYCEKLHKTPAEFETFRDLYMKPDVVEIKKVKTAPQKIANVNRSMTERKVNQKPLDLKDKMEDQQAINKTYAYLNDLLKNPCVQNISNLLRHRRATEFLFNYPLEDGACLFTALFYKKQSREALLFCIINAENKKVVTDGIRENVLCRPYTPKDGQNYNTSPLYWFAASDLGVSALQTLFECDFNIPKYVNLEALCRIHSLDSGISSNISPLYEFLSRAEGRNIIRFLFACNKKNLQEIEADVFFKVPVPEAEKPAVPAFYWLLTTPEGDDILAALNIFNPKIVNSIPDDMLTMLFPASVGCDANIPILHFLAKTKTGRDVLQNLLYSKPELAKNVSVNALCSPLSTDAGAVAKASGLYLLSLSGVGQVALYMIINDNPELIQNIPIEALFPEPGANAIPPVIDTWPFYQLTKHHEGLHVLKILFTANVELAKSVTVESLCLVRTAAGDTDDNISCLYQLACASVGREILKILFVVNPELARAIPVEALCQTPSSRLSSALSNLSLTKEGCEVIEILCANNKPLNKYVAMNLAKSSPSQAGMFSRRASSGKNTESDSCEDSLTGDINFPA